MDFLCPLTQLLLGLTKYSTPARLSSGQSTPRSATKSPLVSGEAPKNVDTG